VTSPRPCEPQNINGSGIRTSIPPLLGEREGVRASLPLTQSVRRSMFWSRPEIDWSFEMSDLQSQALPSTARQPSRNATPCADIVSLFQRNAAFTLPKRIPVPTHDETRTARSRRVPRSKIKIHLHSFARFAGSCSYPIRVYSRSSAVKNSHSVSLRMFRVFCGHLQT